MWRVIIALLMSCAGCVHVRTPAEPKEPTVKAEIEGAYELVSETTVLTKPHKSTERRTSEDWASVWLFHEGRFSETTMKRVRDWYEFPKNEEALGYESSAGRFRTEGTMLVLEPELSLNPLGTGRLRKFQFAVSGETLTLTQTMSPYMEDLSEGERIIVLKRLKSL